MVCRSPLPGVGKPAMVVVRVQGASPHGNALLAVIAGIKVTKEWNGGMVAFLAAIYSIRGPKFSKLVPIIHPTSTHRRNQHDRGVCHVYDGRTLCMRPDLTSSASPALV